MFIGGRGKWLEDPSTSAARALGMFQRSKTPSLARRSFTLEATGGSKAGKKETWTREIRDTPAAPKKAPRAPDKPKKSLGHSAPCYGAEPWEVNLRFEPLANEILVSGSNAGSREQCFPFRIGDVEWTLWLCINLKCQTDQGQGTLMILP